MTTTRTPVLAITCPLCQRATLMPLIEVAPGHSICRRCRTNFGRGWTEQ